jgi:RNA polymerase sigma-70 factor (ECF subfamily)
VSVEAVVVERAGVDAQRAFCEREYVGVARYCHRLVGDEQLARDLTQEAFVRLFGRWRQVEEPRAYVYLVATNLARRTWKRRSTEAVALRTAYAREDVVAAPDVAVRDAVDRLPRKWRDVVVLHYFADLPVADVARQLGQPEGTVRRRLTEARALLAPALGDPR